MTVHQLDVERKKRREEGQDELVDQLLESLVINGMLTGPTWDAAGVEVSVEDVKNNKNAREYEISNADETLMHICCSFFSVWWYKLPVDATNGPPVVLFPLEYVTTCESNQ